MSEYHHITAEDLAVLGVDFTDLGVDNPHIYSVISRDNARQNCVGILGDESGTSLLLSSM